MIRLLLLLLGANAIRRRWRPLLALGLFWGGLGLAIFIDALDGVTVLPIRNVGYLLILEGLIGLAVASAALGRLPRRARMIEAVMLAAAGLLTIEAPWRNDVALALLLGTMFALDGAMKIASARIIRFPGWRSTQAEGALSLVLAILTLQPWPTWYVGTIGCNVGIALMLSGWNVARLALRVHAMPEDAPLSSLMSYGTIGWLGGPAPEPRSRSRRDGALVVHVWTPTGRNAAPSRRPVVDRYIAAVDISGTISTGHAALECGADVYISHYPAVEIERSSKQFSQVLRGTTDNNLPGRFLPDHATEVDGWCEPTAQVRFRTYDPDRLTVFWEAYRHDSTYNLTRRNCSGAVAQALDAALEGQLVLARPQLPRLMRLMVNPSLWLASVLRTRAESMTWTPGLVLDYARALSAVIDPPDVPWSTALRVAWARRMRHRRRARGPS